MKDLEQKLFNCLKEAKKNTNEKINEENYFSEPIMNIGKKIVKVDLNKMVGKPADKNGSKGKWATEDPTTSDADSFTDKKEFDINTKELYYKFQAKDDFFIVGRAGWGKTTLIKKMAKKFGYTINVVYLDKCVKEDLGGIPIPQRSESGVAYQEMTLPPWAAIMYEHPEKKYLLFFDEMNQADPGVMNALMPIVLEKEICGIKFNNFIVGAAGNFRDENDAVYDLPAPLESRFMPIIVWESNTSETWKSAFKDIHKTYDPIIGKDIVDAFENICDLFKNPRDLKNHMFKSLAEIKQSGDYDLYDADYMLKKLMNFVNDDLKKEMDRASKTKLQQLAEQIITWFNSKDNSIVTKSARRTKNKEMVDPKIMEYTKDSIKNGYFKISGDETLYGVSRENIFDLFAGESEDDWMNAEQLQRIINMLEGQGINFKYEKNKDFIKDGYKEYKD